MDIEKLRQELLTLSSEIEQNKNETKSKYIQQHSDEYYKTQIWSSTDFIDVEKIQVELKEVKTLDDIDIFDFIRHNISSMPQFNMPGRVLNVLVYDRTSQKYIGIIQFTSDLLKSEHKDEFIGLEQSKRGRLQKHIRDHSVNLSICVPVQPFGYQFCGGKLLGMLSFSQEIHKLYTTKYSHQVALVVTTSIHGKSIQYDRLREMKLIGYTKGFGTGHINISTYEKIKSFLKQNYPQFDINHESKWQVLKFACDKLKLDTEKIFFHGQKRGIYAGWTSDKGKEFLLKQSNEDLVQNKLKSVNDVVIFWKNRWAKQRSNHLKVKTIA